MPSDDMMRLCLLPDIDYSGIASLLNDLYFSKHYWVGLNVSAVSHLGTVEFRVLSSFADRFKRRGGFLKLENASANVAALVRVFGCTDLLSGASQERPTGNFSASATS